MSWREEGSWKKEALGFYTLPFYAHYSLRCSSWALGSCHVSECPDHVANATGPLPPSLCNGLPPVHSLLLLWSSCPPRAQSAAVLKLHTELPALKVFLNRLRGSDLGFCHSQWFSWSLCYMFPLHSQDGTRKCTRAHKFANTTATGL